MGKQALLAKICVVILLAGNVAAYYCLWPRSPRPQPDNQVQGKAKNDVPAATQPRDVVRPRLIEPRVVAGATPLRNATIARANDEATPDELVQRLLEHMKKEEGGDGPRPLPHLQAKPLSMPKHDPSNVGVTSPLTAKALPSPWTFRKEPAGMQTLLVAELKGAPRGLADFRILCDRVETSDAKEVVALGNVAFAGANLRGECERLIVPILEAKVICKGNVRLHDPHPSALTSERLIWHAPASFSGPTHIHPAILGAPK